MSVFLYSFTAKVMIFSAMLRTSLALVSVVTILPFQMRAVVRFRSIATRWSVGFPSFLFAIAASS
jgi:hypothetical protein